MHSKTIVLKEVKNQQSNWTNDWHTLRHGQCATVTPESGDPSEAGL